MKIQYPKFRIKNRLLLEGGEISLPGRGCYLVKGPNGCGKSCWLKWLHCEHINNSVLVSQNNNEIIRSVSVLQNIIMAETDIESETEIIEFLKKYDLEYLLDLNRAGMSGGEKRLVSLFRGFFSDKEMLLIDEPSNDLDYISVEKIVEIIQSLKSEKLIILVTHDDRFEPVSDGLISFCDKKLAIDCNGGFDKQADFFELSQPGAKKNIKDIFSKKTRILNFLECWSACILMTLAVCIIFIVFFNYSCKSHEESELILTDNQINLFVISSETGGLTGIKYGALEVSNAQEILSSNLFSASKEIEETDISLQRVKTTDLRPLFYDSLLEVYPLELYNYDDKATIYPLREYAASLGYNQDVTYIETLPLFYSYQDSLDENVLEFDSENFLEYVAEHLETDWEGYEVVFVTILKDESMSLSELLSQDSIAGLCEDAQLYIQTNDIIALNNEVAEFSEYKTLIKNSLIISLFAACICIGYQLLCIRVRRRFFRIYSNFGVDKNSLSKAMGRIWPAALSECLLLLFTLIIQIVIMNGQGMGLTVMSLLPIMCIAVIFLFSCIIQKYMIKFGVRRSYSWKRR